MRYFLFLFGFISLSVGAQIVAEPHSVNFGAIERGSDRVVDIQLTNQGQKADLFLRAGFSFEYTYLLSSKSIPADSTITLRVKFNPRQKGPFREKVELWFASMDRPVIIEFLAEVNYIDNSDNPACPSFNDKPSDCCDDLELLVEVRDRMTDKPIRGAQVKMVRNGVPAYQFKTGGDGKHLLSPAISWYYFDVRASGYQRTDTAGYVNRRNDHYVILLESLVPEEPVAEEIPTPPSSRDSITIIAPEPVQELTEITTPDPFPVIPVEGDTDLLPADRYARNNLVFLVDVSQSMANKGKLDLLKAAVFKLSEALRPIDRIAVVTYASEANVLLSSIDGSRKDEIMEAVGSLTAGGMTMGLKGFDTAYEELEKYMDPKANNQLIVVTDGAFRSSDNPRIMKMVERWTAKGVVTSVLGIKGNSLDAERLALIAAQGTGNYLPLDNLDDANAVLLDEIRRQSTLALKQE